MSHETGAAKARSRQRAIARVENEVSRNTTWTNSSRRGELITPTPVPTKASGSTSKLLQPLSRVVLPIEILARIVHFMPVSTLRRFALCCHQFHQLTQPSLFSNIRVTYDLCDFYKVNSRCGLRDLLLHLLTRSCNLAPLVKHVTLQGSIPEPHDHRNPSVRLEKPDWELAMAAKTYVKAPVNIPTNLAITETKDLTFSIGDPVTRLVLLFNLLPRITSLHIRTRGDRILTDGLSCLKAFSELQEITLEYIAPLTEGFDWQLRGPHLDYLTDIPSLQKVCLIRYSSRFMFPSSDPARNPNRMSHTSRIPSLKCLELRESALSPEDLYSNLTSLRQSLKTFICQRRSEENLESGPMFMLLTMGYLFSICTSLESMWLDFTECRPLYTSISMYTLWSNLESSQQLATLQSLCIPLEFFLKFESGEALGVKNFENLPASLETLILISHTEDTPYAVSIFLEGFCSLLLDGCNESDSDIPYRPLPNWRTIVIIVDFNYLTTCTPSAVAQLSSIPNLEFILAAYDRYAMRPSLFESKASSDRIGEIEDLMGLTRLGPSKWKGLDIDAVVEFLGHCEEI